MTIPNGWHIKYNPKPIPIRGHDWDFWHDEVDNDSRLCGTAGSEEEAKLAIMEKQEERHGFDKYANEPDDFDSHVNIESLQYIIADMQRDLLSRDNQITALTTKLTEQEAELVKLRKVAEAAPASPIPAFVTVLQQQIAERDAELSLYRNGYKGACYACESVGELNVSLNIINKGLDEANIIFADRIATLEAARSAEYDAICAELLKLLEV